MKMKVKDYQMAEKLSRIVPGMCPNFYLRGASLSILEEMSLEIVQTIRKEKLNDFRGIVDYFSIKMPYYTTEGEAKKFMEHLQESVSIAKDCYSSFCGTVIVVLAQEWTQKGSNPSLEIFLDYIQAFRQICFILVVPENEKSNNSEQLFSAFRHCCTWMIFQAQPPCTKQCVKEFTKYAKNWGYEVSAEAEMVLLKQLESQQNEGVDKRKIMEQLARQIAFERNINLDTNSIIDAKDVRDIFGDEQKKKSNTIGFIRS